MTQDTALQLLKTGGNVFLTGEPGAGKTYVINQYIAWCEAAGLTVAVTASTGIAATHIGGMTIHSWSGIGPRDTLTARDVDAIAGKDRVARRIRKAHVLVIDEISMLKAEMLDSVDRVCRAARQSSESFGGLQVVFVGDFFQLPPIVGRGEALRYAFESNAWQNAQPLVAYITEQFRQEDELFLGLLSAIRSGQVEEDHYTLLSEQTEIGHDVIDPTRLFTHNADVDALNTSELAALPGAPHHFEMATRGTRQYVESLIRSCLSPQTLVLKEGAMVMCTKNNFEAGYVNGTLGRVLRFESEHGYPVIETTAGREITITPQSWSVSENGAVRAEITQVPLRLAWAITVHKSQGMSLDAAEIDLTRAFVYGQGYVALSRVRALAGLKLTGIGANALMVDPRIITTDERFRTESEAAERTFREMEHSELTAMHENFIRAHGGRVPRTDEVVARQTGGTPPPPRSTIDETKSLIDEKQSVAAIAKARNLTQSTVWNHLEKLTEADKLRAGDIDYLLPEDWQHIWSDIQMAIDTHGDEKLKPLFEHCNEEYDYAVIRLGRIYHRLNHAS